MESVELLREAIRIHGEGIPLCAVTVAGARGSIPQEIGAKAIIGSDGLICGTIGGGKFLSKHSIGDRVEVDEVVGTVNGAPVKAAVSGILRGLIRSGMKVGHGLKLGDIDPRARAEYCYTISDKARAIAGSVLESIMRYNQV